MMKPWRRWMLKYRAISGEEDHKQCLKLRYQVFVEEQGVEPDLEITDEKDSIHFLAERDGSVIGTGRFRIHGNLLKFERVAVLKAMRGQGVGKGLLEFMQKKGFNTYPEYLMFMHAQTHAQLFYEKLGWRPVGEPFDEDNIEHIAMVLTPTDVTQLKAYHDPQTPDLLKKFLIARKS